MPQTNVAIRRYLDLAPSDSLLAGLDEVFFESSNTKSFASEEAREAFRRRWLGRYLAHDPQFAYVALDANGAVAGYLVGAIADPALTERFSDIGYFQAFGDLTRKFPAHLHVNLAPSFRGAGLGAQLIERFLVDAKAAGAPGVHVTTSRFARNVGFYQQNGFVEQGATGKGPRETVLLARAL